MFTIKIKNGDVLETVDRKLVKTENQASILTFSLLYNSPYFSSLEEFITKIELYDRKNTKIFDGRVIHLEESISSDEIPCINVTCESVLNYLCDSRCGKWAIHPVGYEEGSASDDGDVNINDTEKSNDPFTVYENMTVSTYLQLLLDNHNSKVTDDKKIYLGNVTVSGNVYCYNSRETTLNAIIDKLVNRKGGIIKIREYNNKYYLDYLNEIESTQGIIELGTNVITYNKSNSLEGVYTRIIPIGADGLTIKSVNNGVEYVENTELKAKYGVIETVVKFDDVTIAENLKSKAQAMLQTINNYQNIFDINVVDISYISDNFTEFTLSQKCRIKNKLFNDDEVQRIVKIELNLDDVTESTISLSALSYSAVSTTVNNIQAQQNAEINQEVTEEAIRRRLSKGQFNSYFEQTTKKFEFTIGDPAGNTNVIIDKTGLTVKNGAIAIKNSSGDTVMTVDKDGNLATNRLMVVGDGSNTVEFTGKGTKFINLNSSDGGAVFVYFKTGQAVGRVGTYPGRDEIFIETGTIGVTERGKVILRGINSTIQENEPCDLEVHGNIYATGTITNG